MRKYLFLILFIVQYSFAFTQEWAPSGATWYYTYKPDLSYGYVKIQSIGDTIIQEKPCKSLRQIAYGWTSPGYLDTIDIGVIHTYEEGDKVYYLVEDQFYVLYDFNAKKGDSWIVKHTGQPCILDTTGIIIVDSTSFEIINDDTLTCLYISPKEGSCVGYYPTKIIEKIGCINTYMFPEFIGCVIDAIFGGPLRCYYDNDLTYNTNIVNSCDYILSKGKQTISPLIEVYPNPFVSNFIIKNNSSLLYKLSIYNLSGVLILEDKVDKFSNKQIELEFIKDHVFFLKMYSTEFEYTRILIKE
jgi:hypothetical protein